MSSLARLALVAGEPAGIGPELCVKLAYKNHGCELLVLADPDLLQQAANALGLSLLCKAPGQTCGMGELSVLPFKNPHPVQFGQINPQNSAQVIAALNYAGQGCLNGEFDGVITGPVHKAAVNAADIAYTGTTELLAEQAQVPVVMMLANASMRVALATTHLPLRKVAEAITFESLEQTLRIIHHALQSQFGISAPRIAVLGLNPHAGEQGILGREEIEIITPVLNALRSEGFLLDGPIPADTAFIPARLENIDAVLAMYHDQGLPVLKYAGFESAVNITLGLPYPRVAVDHGTALELAGQGTASDESLWQALQHCKALALQGKKQ